LSVAELDALADEATVDCYNEEEQATGFSFMSRCQIRRREAPSGSRPTVTGRKRRRQA